MLSHRSGTRFEDLAFINVVNGQYAVNKDYDVESKAKMNKPMKQLLEESGPGTIIAIHNHPGSSVPSLADLMTCVKRGYNFGLVACHDGKVYKYWVDKNKFNSVNAGFALDRMETQGYDKRSKNMARTSRSVFGGVVAWMKCIKEYAINWVVNLKILQFRSSIQRMIHGKAPLKY